MLVPRPETSTPTRTRSAMVGRAPRFPGTPAARRAGDGAALRTLLHDADMEDSFSCILKGLGDAAHIPLRHDHSHSDAAIEGPGHLLGLDIALRLEEGHQPRLRPGAGIDMGVKAFGEDSR